MNKKRRKDIEKIISAIENVKNQMEEILDDERYALDNTPENLRCSLRVEESENAIEYLEDSVDYLDNCISALEII